MFGKHNFVSGRLDPALPLYCRAEEKSQPPSPAPTSITHPENPLNPLLLLTSGSSSEDEDCSSPLRRSESFYTRPSPEKKSEENNSAEPHEETVVEPLEPRYNSDSDLEEEEVTMINLKPYASSASPLKGILGKNKCDPSTEATYRQKSYLQYTPWKRSS